MPPSYPPHPGHQIGHSLLVVLGPWRWPVVDSGNWALPSDNRRVLVHGAVVALLWPTESIVRVQPKVGWDTLPASSCRPFRIPSFHELEYLFKLTRASERRPSVLMYPCTTSAHPLPLRVGCNLPAYQRVSTLLPHAAMFISNSEARGRFFFSPAAHYSTSSPVDMGLATVFFFFPACATDHFGRGWVPDPDPGARAHLPEKSSSSLPTYCVVTPRLQNAYGALACVSESYLALSQRSYLLDQGP
jgi:hypothetical protein